MNQIVAKLAPVLAAGCTCVLKPSELAPLSAHIMAEILQELDKNLLRQQDLRTSLGAVAQLGERYNGIVEVVGSIPSGSTVF